MGPRSRKVRAAAAGRDDIVDFPELGSEGAISKKVQSRPEPEDQVEADEPEAALTADGGEEEKALYKELPSEQERATEATEATEADEPQGPGSGQQEAAPASEQTPSNLQHVNSGDIVSPDMHADRRVMGAAATVGGAAGMLLMGPVSGVALGTAALYAATREDGTGAVTRKVGSAYLQLADKAVDSGLQAIDQGVKMLGQAVDKGCERLSNDVDLSSVPAPLRSGVYAVLNTQTKPAPSSAASAEEARRIREKYPDRIPVICNKSQYSTGLPEITKKKFVVPGTMLCGEFKYMIHKHLSEALKGDRSAEQTIYIFANGLAPKTSTPMSELYDKMRADDGFLYITYGAENTLG